MTDIRHGGQNPQPQVHSFTRRHIGPGPDDIGAMLQALRFESTEALLAGVVPASIYRDAPLGLGDGAPEHTVRRELQAFAAANQRFRSLIGQGFYDTLTPAVIQRNVLENPAWYTAYTPYQAEISQGRMEAILNFQTMIADLTGLPLANASLLDDATAAAEAMTFCRRVSRAKATRFFVSDTCHPHIIEVVRTRAEPLGIPLIVGDHRRDLEPQEVFGALLAYPASDGTIHDYRSTLDALRDAGAISVIAADLLSLTLLTPPGDLGADVAIGSAQRFGVPLGFGGPHAAYFATKEAHKRAVPGRLIGVSVDRRGDPALRLALQTREQHIRREKATSNICTAQALLAVMAGCYAVYHGPEGLTAIAAGIHAHTRQLAAALTALGLAPQSADYFDTLVVACPDHVGAVREQALAAEINFRYFGDGRIGISLDEKTDAGETAQVAGIFAHALGQPVPEMGTNTSSGGIPEALRRRSEFLTHPVFHQYRSETEMMRYLRRLADRDLALDRAMIPLGSCTMKLNAAVELEPLSWPDFADLHPFSPPEQSAGYQEMFRQLEEMLVKVSGYDAVSLQPNAGSQGEYAGLLAIRAYHRARGEAGRDICLIPSSAHGTNPASAQMAGMTVVVVACDDEGNIDVADLTAKSEQHSDQLAALMVTYPSTHGVFETRIEEICQIIHDHGGQVYLDGANMNAMVGVAAPGLFGADVSHFNLHKTFCIPHGGGGPGMGPIGVKAHLEPFLPRHDCGDAVLTERTAVGPIAAAPWGSALILTISWAYMRLMGDAGLRDATAVAILNANYIAERLAPYYPILYTGENGRVAHECILDLRPMKESAGVTVDDVAKRLIDYGFHAPTMSFPVAGTLMVEPTESESRAELDRFCDAMIAIRQEIAAIERGDIALDAAPLSNAPHVLADLIAEPWPYDYSREKAAYPGGYTGADKYWPPVARVDNVFGDRHLTCTCPPLSAYTEAAE